MKLVYKIVQQHSVIKEQERLDSILFSKYCHVYFWAGRRTVYTRKREPGSGSVQFSEVGPAVRP